MYIKSTCLAIVACSVYLTAAVSSEVAIPTFDHWEINPPPAGYAGMAEVFPPDRDYPQGRIVAKGAEAEKTFISVFCTVPVETGQEYRLTLDLESGGANEQAVPAFRCTVKNAAGTEVIVNDGGLPKAAIAGYASSRTFVCAENKLASSADGQLRLTFYVMGLKSGSVTLTGAKLVAVGASQKNDHQPAEFPDGRGGLIFNEDCTEFFYSRPAEDMNIEGLKRYMDRYLPHGHQIRIIMLNPGSHNNNFGATSSPVMWEGVTFNADGTATDRFGKKLEPGVTRMYRNMKSFCDNGINVYHVWIDHLRQRGVSPWVSLRMNDAHDAMTPDEERTDHRKDPEFRIAAYNPGDWHDQSSDYEKPEVRQLFLSIMDDYMETFDADGFEMDWMRFGRFFKHGREIVCAPLLTDMMRHFRAKADEMAARRGRPVKIAVRVPPRPDAARRLGYDVQAWADERLFDILIPTNFLWSTDADCPVADWRRIVGSDVLIAPGIERAVNPYVNTGFCGDAAIRRGFAAGWFHRGADMVYLFNHMSMDPDMNDGIMCTVGAPATAEKGARRHPLTFPDFPYIGTSRSSELPAAINPQVTRAFRIPVGKAPAPGRHAWVVAGFNNADAPVPQCRLNSVLLPQAKRLPPSMLGDFIKKALAWNIPDGILLDDENVVEITNDADKQITANWIEIQISAE
ncbi:MAG: hypothetical protein GX946_11455 [Oligosphaeraceae bacterium]|nr:hypothetical protein [Oligosphaeraceae bacterium]